MANQRNILRGMVLLGWVLACAHAIGQMAPGVLLPSTDLPPAKPKKIKPKFSTYLPEKPSLQPVFQIPVARLGFAAPPSSYYLGRQNSLVSLGFLDENHLLFTFHAAGLQQRETTKATETVERQIRAVAIALPEGKVEAQSSWTVPDRAQYLWMLKDGQFLLRTPGGLKLGDSELEMQSLSQPADHVLSVALNPGQDVIVTTSAETASLPSGARTAATSGMPSSLTTAHPMDGEQGDTVMRATQWRSGKILGTQRISSAFNAPINSDGYVEAFPAGKYKWTLTLKSFGGGNRALTTVDSGCAPNSAFITDQELFLTSCTPEGGLRLAAVSTSGRMLWATEAPPEPVWPLLFVSPDGSRLAREALVLKDSVNLKKHPKFVKAVKGQIVRVMDAANGKIVFEAPLSPVLDGGGNVAFSPAGRRVAILDDGAIQVFDLPGAPAVSTVPNN